MEEKEIIGLLIGLAFVSSYMVANRAFFFFVLKVGKDKRQERMKEGRKHAAANEWVEIDNAPKKENGPFVIRTT